MIQAHTVLATLATPVDVIDVDDAAASQMYVLRSILQSRSVARRALITVTRNGETVLEEWVDVLAKQGQSSAVNTLATSAFVGSIGDHLTLEMRLADSEETVYADVTLTPVKGKRRSVNADSDSYAMAG